MLQALAARRLARREAWSRETMALLEPPVASVFEANSHILAAMFQHYSSTGNASLTDDHERHPGTNASTSRQGRHGHNHVRDCRGRGASQPGGAEGRHGCPEGLALGVEGFKTMARDFGITPQVASLQELEDVWMDTAAEAGPTGEATAARLEAAVLQVCMSMQAREGCHFSAAAATPGGAVVTAIAAAIAAGGGEAGHSGGGESRDGPDPWGRPGKDIGLDFQGFEDLLGRFALRHAPSLCGRGRRAGAPAHHEGPGAGGFTGFVCRGWESVLGARKSAGESWPSAAQGGNGGHQPAPPGSFEVLRDRDWQLAEEHGRDESDYQDAVTSLLALLEVMHCSTGRETMGAKSNLSASRMVLDRGFRIPPGPPRAAVRVPVGPESSPGVGHGGAEVDWPRAAMA